MSQPQLSEEADVQSQKVTVAYTNQPCRRKLQFINGKFAVQKPQTSTVQKRNERERNRVKLINRTFSTLRDRLPKRYSGKKAKKLSKVEVLKTASTYIAYLARLLESDVSTDPGEFSFDEAQQKQQPQPPKTSDVQNPTAPQPAVDWSSGMCDFSDLLLSDDDDEATPATAAAASGDINDSGLFHLSAETVDISSVSCSPSDPQQPQQQQQQQQQFPSGNYAGYFNMSTPVKPTQNQQLVPSYYLVAAAQPACATSVVPEFVTAAATGHFDCSATSEVHFLSISDPLGNAGYLQYL